jgi:hypothetical protein
MAKNIEVRRREFLRLAWSPATILADIGSAR